MFNYWGMAPGSYRGFRFKGTAGDLWQAFKEQGAVLVSGAWTSTWIR